MDNNLQAQTDYDVLVIGSGIGGMESSIKLADARLRQLYLWPEDVVDHQPPQHHHQELQRGPGD
jgi:thioredoxin reductase